MNGHNFSFQTIFSKLQSTYRSSHIERSPYLRYPQRLADVITAIQLMGTYKYASRKIGKWNDAIGRDPLSAKSWIDVFKQHPEFFRIKNNDASLIWRRSREKTYDTRNGAEITSEEYKNLSDDEKRKFSRRPLDPEHVQALINSAVQMHSSAISQQKDKRWWVAIVASLAGVVLGTLLIRCS